LLGMMLFNWFGYRWLAAFLEDFSKIELQAQLDRDQYDPAELVLIKIPATHLSYYNPSESFERVRGEVEIEGVLYSYVKLRLFNDSLELLCLPNQKATRLQTAKDDFFKLVNDFQQPTQPKKADDHPSVVKVYLPDDFTNEEPFQLHAPYFSRLNKFFHSNNAATLHFSLTIDYPPESRFSIRDV
jgi:hypothetical protein